MPLIAEKAASTGRQAQATKRVPPPARLLRKGLQRLGLHPDDPDKVRELMITTIAGEMTEGEPFDGYLVLQGGLPETEQLIGKVWW